MQEFNKIWKNLQRELNPEEQKNLQNWIGLSEENEQLSEEIEVIWEQSGKLEDIQILDSESGWMDIESKLNEKSPVRYRIGRIRWIGIAASILLVASLFMWYQLNQKEPLYQTFYTGQEKAEIRLPDGTIVLLDKESSIRYYTRLEETMESRTVYISGHATCQVAKDTVHPFIAEIGKTGVRALGTSFRLSQKDTANISVENIEGLIKFFELANEENAVVLKQGEVFTYDGKGFKNVTPGKPLPKSVEPGKIYSVEEIIDFLLTRFDGKFNTGPYGNFDLKATLRVDLDQSLPEILEQLRSKATIQYKKTCPDCYQLDAFQVSH